MSVPRLSLVELATGAPGAAVLVVGPSLGTSVVGVWGAVAERLRSTFSVLGWDLPGHASSAPDTDFTVADLAAAVLTAVEGRLGGATIDYAGDSLGAAVGLQLLLDAPDRVRSATLCCTGATIGQPEDWAARAAAVRDGGTAVLLDSAPGRWFAPGFGDRAPQVAATLLDDLGRCDSESYAAACEALATYDVRSRLAEIATPVLAIAGDHDLVTPPSLLRHVASGVRIGRCVVLDGVAHLAPAEAPDQVAELIVEHTGEPVRPPQTADQVRAEGMRVRREVLGDAHVDRALENTTDLTAEFQDFITGYAWGGIWTRPGLDRRSRSLVTLTALVSRGHHEELAMHLRAARRNGLSLDEIKEVLLQTAVYCGVPEANTAFRIAQRVLAEDADDPTTPKKDE